MTDKRARLHDFEVGETVVLVDDGKAQHFAVITEVPEHWRDESGGKTTTLKGHFAKAWVRIEDHEPIPWPLESIAKEREIDPGEYPNAAE